MIAPVPVPLVRYAAKRPTGPARAPTKTGKSKRRKQSQRQSSSDESPDYSSEEPEEPEEPNWAEKGVPESWPDLSSPLTVGAFVVTEDEFIVRKRTRYGISVCKVHTPSSAPPLLSSSAPQFFFLFFFFGLTFSDRLSSLRGRQWYLNGFQRPPISIPSVSG